MSSTDSRQLQQLRLLFCDIQTRAPVPRRATPLRLGRFAGERAIFIHDMGAHSDRWRRLYRRGYSEGTKYRSELKLK